MKHESWDLPFHTRSQVLSPKYDMDAYMAKKFGGEARNLESWVKRMLNPTLSTNPAHSFS